MRRETQNILLVLLGGALLKISLSGLYLRYVKASHQWLLVAAGAIILLLALVSIVRDFVARWRSGYTRQDGHQHASRSAWLLLLPVLAVFLVAPPALGADSVQGAGTSNTGPPPEDGSALFPSLPADEVVALPLSGFVERAAWDRGHSLDDRAIQLTGFVVHDGDAVYIARLAIGCCAADAMPVKVKLDGSPEVDALADDSWIEAVVTVKPGSATKANEYVPAATVTTVRRIRQPENSYELRPR